MSFLLRYGLALFGLCVGIILSWFIPWVFTLQMGFLAYFPYEPNGTDRFLRIVGPWASPLSGQQWTPQSQIPEGCAAALVASEDTLFFQHAGVDWDSLFEQWQNVQKKGVKKVRGASTITQQIVKNAFLSRDRSVLRKSRELTGALLLDFFTSKERQLTWYFNIVEWGPRVYGIHQASAFYFHKKPSQLTPGECVRLVALLPSPVRWSKYVKHEALAPAFWTRRVGVIRRRMEIMGAVAVRPGFLPSSKRQGVSVRPSNEGATQMGGMQPPTQALPKEGSLPLHTHPPSEQDRSSPAQPVLNLPDLPPAPDEVEGEDWREETPRLSEP